MLIILSPSKTQDYLKDPQVVATKAIFTSETKQLRQEIEKLTPKDIEKLMKLSPKLSMQAKEITHEIPAIQAFKGTVYNALDAESFTDEDLKFAQEHLRIISGMYGLLRPLDGISYYRLDMGTKLKTKKGDNLYEFWGDKILNLLVNDAKERAIINLASNEYSSAAKIEDKQILITFKETKNNEFKVIGIHAKKARGTMAHYIIKNKITDPLKIKNFQELNYQFNKELSSPNEFVFTR